MEQYSRIEYKKVERTSLSFPTDGAKLIMLKIVSQNIRPK